MTILQIAIPSPLWKSFDYLPPEQIEPDHVWLPGIRVRVPFGRQKVVGVVMSVQNTTLIPLDKLKRVYEVLDITPILPPSLLALCQWASDYYHHPLGEVIESALPKQLREGRPGSYKMNTSVIATASEADADNDNDKPELLLSDEQQHAITAIRQAQGFQTFLLDGITGSGKTEIYLQCIASLIQAGKQALVLVPEIALTPQTVTRFTARFCAPHYKDKIVLLHSGLTDKERTHAWLQARQGEAAIVIGTRSAIFTPLLHPGIIILDEEHDLSFKQQSGFRYFARDLAMVRARLEQIPVVLGSATPSLESLHNVMRQRYHHLRLTKRAQNIAPPQISLINLRDQRLNAGLSTPLLNIMEQHLANGKQVLLFLNRRGYAPVLMCHHCGWMASCDHCDARLTLHHTPPALHCHHCGISKALIRICGACQQSEVMPVGQGTEKLEKLMCERFPNYHTVRIDRDSTRKKGSMQQLLTSIIDEKAQILIGTQMLAKGHHFPNLTLVAIVDVDGGLFSSDFRSMERMAQLLTQVAGRAGRVIANTNTAEVILQTHHPDHPLLQLLLTQGYHAFAHALLHEREQAELPPYHYLALLRAEAKQPEMTLTFLQHNKTIINQFISQQSDQPLVEVLGPVPAPMERRASYYRSQLLLQAKNRPALQQILRSLILYLSQTSSKNSSKVRWSLDVDPQEMG